MTAQGKEEVKISSPVLKRKRGNSSDTGVAAVDLFSSSSTQTSFPLLSSPKEKIPPSATKRRAKVAKVQSPKDDDPDDGIIEYSYLRRPFALTVKENRTPDKKNQLRTFDAFANAALQNYLPGLPVGTNLCKELGLALVVRLALCMTHAIIDELCLTDRQRISKKEQDSLLANPWIHLIAQRKFVDLSHYSPYPCHSVKLRTIKLKTGTEPSNPAAELHQDKNEVLLLKYMEGDSVKKYTVR